MNLPRIMPRCFSAAAKLFLLTVIFSATLQAQSSSVDLSFNAVVSKDINGGNFTLQPDGKILVFGNFQVVNGAVKNQIARLNADGSLDNSFDCAACDFVIGSAIVQPDGKIFVAGSFYSTVTQSSVARIKRLNADGSLDNTFTSPFGEPIPTANSSARVWTTQPDGKVLIETLTSASGNGYREIARLNSNGSFDNTFARISIYTGRVSSVFVTKLMLQPDGKILVSTSTNAILNVGSLNRYNSDGTRDATFESPNLSANGNDYSSTYLFDFDIQPDGKIVIGGLFDAVNGVDRPRLARLMPAGNVDLSFAPPNVFVVGEPVARVKVLSNGKILISSGELIGNPFNPQSNGNRFFRFNADGSLDNTFASPGGLTSIVKWEVYAGDRVLLYGGFTENGVTVFRFARLTANGNYSEFLDAYFGAVGSITTLAVQPDGKVLFAGDFNRVSGVLRRDIVRVNADGTLDASFNATVKIDAPITKIVVQPDGKILLAGSFTVNNNSGFGIVRLNSDGSLDAAFNPGISYVSTIVLQADGKILVGGSFTDVNGQTRIGLARLNSNGTTDASFNASFGAVTFIRSVVVQADGKIIIGGTFNAVGGFARQNLVRLNADGSLDASFNAGSISPVNQVEPQADGKYLVLTGNIIRLNNNGSADATFQSLTIDGTINSFLAQPDGTIIIGGNFSAVNGVARANFARLQANGTLAAGFFPNGAGGAIRTIVRQADGKIFIGGDFTNVENVARLGIARLNVNSLSAPFTPFDFDGDGRADVSVFRPSNGYWYALRSQNNSFNSFQFGSSGDQIAPADYDGDGKTDIAVFRGAVPGAGNFAYFYITNSSDNSFRIAQFGSTGDVPICGDWDGDGKADLAVYRNGASGGQSYFFYRPSSQPGADFRSIPWGSGGDKPVSGDFDGDGKLDAAVYRPSVGTWFILKSSNNQVAQVSFGLATDVPVPADFNGDGATEFAVFRPSNGYWYVARSTSNSSQNFDSTQFGAQGDLPVPADYDGDGKADIAVYRPSNGVWYLFRSAQGFTAVAFGIGEDKPIPNAYIR